LPAADLTPLRVLPQERGQLLSLLTGALSEPDVLAALRRSWGLCPRHTWAVAALECELRGGIVYNTATLFAPLLARAARVAAGRALFGGPALRRGLAAQMACPVCAGVIPIAGPEPLTVGASSFSTVLRRAGAYELFACPACVGGEGIVCRPHLLGGVVPGRRISRPLSALARRVAALADALAFDVHPLATAEAEAWIAAVGWLAGWGFVLPLDAGQPDAVPRAGNGRVPDAILER
jgi:hypothetical protein